MTASERTKKYLTELGMEVGLVERYVRHAGPYGKRVDLFGIIDYIAISPEYGVVGVQSTGEDFAAHDRKIMKSPYRLKWLASGTKTKLWLIGWRKLKIKGTNRKEWVPRIKKYEELI